MPHTTELGSSCTRVAAPAWRSSSRPRAPSSPMPVSRAAMVAAPALAASERNNTSTLGRCRFTGGPSCRRQTYFAPSHMTSKWWLPGAM